MATNNADVNNRNQKSRHAERPWECKKLLTSLSSRQAEAELARDRNSRMARLAGCAGHEQYFLVINSIFARNCDICPWS